MGHSTQPPHPLRSTANTIIRECLLMLLPVIAVPVSLQAVKIAAFEMFSSDRYAQVQALVSTVPIRLDSLLAFLAAHVVISGLLLIVASYPFVVAVYSMTVIRRLATRTKEPAVDHDTKEMS